MSSCDNAINCRNNIPASIVFNFKLSNEIDSTDWHTNASEYLCNYKSLIA